MLIFLTLKCLLLYCIVLIWQHDPSASDVPEQLLVLGGHWGNGEKPQEVQVDIMHAVYPIFEFTGELLIKLVLLQDVRQILGDLLNAGFLSILAFFHHYFPLRETFLLLRVLNRIHQVQFFVLDE